MKLIRLTQVKGDLDIIINTAHIIHIEITEEGWSCIQLTNRFVNVKQSFNEIMKLSKEA
jgi:hypothetical protein